MQLEDKIGQMLMVGFDGFDVPDYILEWLQTGRVGGIILFARNVDTPEQVARLTQRLHAAAKYPLLIGIDQEGGTVARLRQGFSESPGAMALSAAQDGVGLAEKADEILGLELRALGINWDFAPALDITYNAANPAVGTRSFGADAARVAEMGAAAVRGFQRGGVAATAKHFPGLGSTATDTHLALPVLDTSVEQLMGQDMRPFRAAIDAGLASVMTTHTIYAALDSKLPATLSPIIIQKLLRGELGFEGAVSSDCMEMKAIADNFSPAETATLGALAGLDMIVFSHTRATQEAAHDGLVASVKSGRVPMERIEEANRRLATLKQKYPAQQPDLSLIRQPAHVELMLNAARAGVTLLREEVPLPIDEGAVLVEFASHLESGILESGGVTGLGTHLRRRFPQLRSASLVVNAYTDRVVAEAEALVKTSKTLVLATRNAHLNADQLDAARRLVSAAQAVVLVCLRNPYDAMVFPSAGTVICTCGDSAPSLQAAAEVLSGQFRPTGKLPVSMKAHVGA
ncbi:MAG: beta-N-acetylhexosaminidase [Anaerolineae bacterium]|nr:beta-N-acetylhexosaminidase [Anaerolineae bacterium]